MDVVDHTVTVTASTLYEAVALGLVSIRGEEWVAGIAEGLNAVRVLCDQRPGRALSQDAGFQRVARPGGRIASGARRTYLQP
jgi:hypothetical protein